MKHGKRYNINILAEEIEYKRKLNRQRKENIKLFGLLFLSLFAICLIFYIRFILFK